MKALSIRQPWAWCIVHLGKDIENRTWPTKYRGQVLIHASKKINAAAVNHLKSLGYKLPNEFETGGIVGMVTIVDCVENSKSPWFRGPYGFVMKDAKPLKFKPCRGKLSFFTPIT